MTISTWTLPVIAATAAFANRPGASSTHQACDRDSLTHGSVGATSAAA
jgi:hypothetical protein